MHRRIASFAARKGCFNTDAAIQRTRELSLASSKQILNQQQDDNKNLRVIKTCNPNGQAENLTAQAMQKANAGRIIIN